MNIHKSIVGLMTILWSAMLYGQDCVSFTGPQAVFPDQIDTTYIFPVFNMDSTMLGVNQSVCKVNISFATTHIQEIQISLTSPAGEEIILVGSIVNTSPNSTPNTTWDISFVPLDSMAAPDIGYSETWDNNQLWVTPLFGDGYSGTYYPFNGTDLKNYRVGSVAGEWKLRILDGLVNNGVQTKFNSFSIEFCNPSGIDCSECFAEADTVLPQVIEFCQNDVNRSIEFSDYLKDTTHIDSLPLGFTFRSVLVSNDTVVDYRDTDPLLDLSDLPAGNYQIYGMAYSDSYVDDVPVPDSTFTIDSLRIMIDSLPRIFCGDLTKDAITVVIEPVNNTVITTTLCSGDSLVVGDSIFRESVVRQVSLLNRFGCDSVVNVNLTVRNNILTIIDTAICFGDSILIDNVWYSNSVNLTDTLTAAAGCDSIVLLDLEVRDFDFQSISRKICGGDSYNFFGNPISLTGIYRDSSSNIYGCDSVVQLNLEVVTEFLIDTSATICFGDSFMVGTKYYNMEGLYQDTLLSTLGCDSIIDLELVIRDPIQTLLTETICFGDSFLIGNTFYKVPGLHEEMLTSIAGCDSTVRVDLSIRDPNFSERIETICFGDSILSGDTYYKESGVHKDTLPDQFGCDSIITLDLTVRPENRTNLTNQVCFGDSVVVGNTVYKSTGQWTTIIPDQFMCDSIIVLDLTVDDPIVSALDSTICRGDSIVINNQVFKESGSYGVLFERDGLCDSTVQINLTVIDETLVELPIRLCEGNSYMVGESTYTTAGIYRDTLTSIITGCDSIVVLDLQYDPIEITPLSETICDGDSILFNNVWLKDSGIYDDTLTAITSCDSILRLDFKVLSLDDPVEIFETLCFGDSLLFKGSFLKDDGIYRDTLISTKNCDSVVVLDLQFGPEIRIEEQRTICLGDTLFFENAQFTTSGEFPFIYSSVEGCDSTIVLELIVEECPIEVEVLAQNSTCKGLQNGLIEISIDYGNPPYDVFINNSATAQIVNTFEGSTLFNNLVTGNYEIRIAYQSPEGMDRDTTFNVAVINETRLSISSQEIVNPSCNGNADGAITIGVIGGLGPYMAEWNNGASGFSQSDLSSSNYQVFVADDQGCLDTFNFELIDPEAIIFEIATTSPSCNGESDGRIEFTNVIGGAGNYEYTVSGVPQSNPVFELLEGGLYEVMVEDGNGCIAISETELLDPVPFFVSLGEDITLDNVGAITLNASANASAVSYEWRPNVGLSCVDCSNPTVTIDRTITYTVIATNEFGCQAEDVITVILDIDRSVDPASAFSPNADGVNDIFIVHGDRSIEQIRNLEIYSRSGELVFKQEGFPINDPGFGWDGTFKGQSLNSQMLAYFMEVVYTDGKSKVFKGQIALVR